MSFSSYFFKDFFIFSSKNLLNKYLFKYLQHDDDELMQLNMEETVKWMEVFEIRILISWYLGNRSL